MTLVSLRPATFAPRPSSASTSTASTRPGPPCVRHNRLTDLVTGGVDRRVGHHVRHRARARRPRDPAAHLPARGRCPTRAPTCRSSCGSTAAAGCWATSSATTRSARYLAAEVGCVVVSVDYRWPPSTGRPTAAHDCVDATTWVRASTATCCGPTPRGWRWPATRRAATSRPSSPRCCATTGHPAAAPGADLPRDRPDDVVPVGRASTPTRPASPSAHGRLPRPLRAGPGTTCATRCCRRSSAGSTDLPPGAGADGRPRPDPRRRHPVRRGAARCGRAGAAHELPAGAARLRVRARARPRPWAASSGGSWSPSWPPRSRPRRAARLRSCARSSSSRGRPTRPSPTGSATSSG